MSWLQNISINRKILWVNLFSLLLLATILGTMIWDSLDRMMVENLEKRGSEIGSHVALLSANYILIEDYYAIYELISQTLEANDDIRYILMIDSQNQLISHTFPKGVPQGILQLSIPEEKKDYYFSALSSEEGNIYDILVPIEHGSVGFVRIGMSEERAKTFIIKKVQELVLATLLVCGIAAVIIRMVMEIITRPIKNLVQVVAKITAGELGVRAEVASQDEIGKLATAFNRMTDSLILQREEQEKLLVNREALLLQLQERDRLRDTLINKLMTAQEDERKRISRELHDETSQGVTSLMVAMRVLAEDAENEAQREALLASRDVAATVLQGIREMAVDLRPPVLDDLGLVSAIRKYVDKFQERLGILVELEMGQEEMPIPPEGAVALYRILQEGLNNIVKHSKATSIKIHLEISGKFIVLRLCDNGTGISSAIIEQARRENRLGLYGMQERAELMGGNFAIQGLASGGTELKVAIPLQVGV